MFNILKNKIASLISKSSKFVGLGKIQNLLEKKFADLVESVFDNRKKDNANSKLKQEDIPKVINGYLVKNIALATASSFVPGPVGMFAAIPNMVVALSNQMKCIYDLSCAYDKEDFINKDLLLDIPLHAMGIPSGLEKLQDAKNLTDSASDVLLEKAKGLSKVLVVKRLKKSLTSMVPGLGTAFAIVQAKMDTAKIAATTMTFLDPNMSLTEPIIDETIDESSVQEQRIKALINLMTIDGEASKSEQKFILPLIDKSKISEELKNEFRSSLNSSATDFTIDYDLLKRSGESENLIVDLVVLTKRDGTIAQGELQYIEFAAKKLNIHPIVYEKLME